MGRQKRPSRLYLNRRKQLKSFKSIIFCFIHKHTNNISYLLPSILITKVLLNKVVYWVVYFIAYIIVKYAGKRMFSFHYRWQSVSLFSLKIIANNYLQIFRKLSPLTPFFPLFWFFCNIFSAKIFWKTFKIFYLPRITPNSSVTAKIFLARKGRNRKKKKKKNRFDFECLCTDTLESFLSEVFFICVFTAITKFFTKWKSLLLHWISMVEAFLPAMLSKHNICLHSVDRHSSSFPWLARRQSLENNSILILVSIPYWRGFNHIQDKSFILIKYRLC